MPDRFVPLRPLAALAVALAAPAAAASGATSPQMPAWPVVASGSTADRQPDKDRDKEAPEGSESAAPAEPIESVDDLLGALEEAGRDIRTLRARVRYTRIFAIAGDEQIRTGELFYIGAPADAPDGRTRKFAVRFERLQLGTGEGARIDRERKRYVFDGQWLVEAMPDQKQMVKRQVVPPGESFDPLRLGEGPFPIPIGQNPDQIRSRFEPAMPEPREGLDKDALIEFITRTPCHQLHLTTREPYIEKIGLEEVRVWYASDSLLPRLAWTRKPDGDEAFVQLVNVRTNEPIPPEAVSTETPERGWDVDIRPWRREAGRPGPEDGP